MKALFLVRMYSGCQLPDSECWKLNVDYKKLAGSTEAFLTLPEDVMIDAGWVNPRLVFWNKRDLIYEAKITLFVDGTAIDLYIIPKGTVASWR